MGTGLEDPGLAGVLSRFASRRRRLGRLAAAGAGTAFLLASMLALGWFDFLVDLPGEARLAGLGVAVLAATAVVYRGLGLAEDAARPERVAAAVDRSAGSGGAVLAGWELSSAPESWPDPLSADLARRAADSAQDLASGTPVAATYPGTIPRGPWLAGLGVAAAIGLAFLAWPSLVVHQVLRLLDPMTERPPFALHEYEVAPGDVEIHYGDPVDVRARVRGEDLPGSLQLVQLRADGTTLRHPLFEDAGGAWEGSLGLVTQPLAYWVEGPRSRSRRHRVRVITVPRIDRVEVRVEPPPYTRKPAWDGPFPDAGLEGVLGTRVVLRVHANRPLREGALTWSTGGVPLDLVPGSAVEIVTREFLVREDAEFDVTVTDRDGQVSRRGFHGRIRRIPDRPPSVSLLEPAPDNAATPDAKIPVVVEAEDDFGVRRLALHWKIGEVRVERPLPVPPDEEPLVQAGTVLDLGALGAKPGDVVELFAVALDNDPTGEKAGHSKVHRIRIVSTEEFLELARARQGIEELVDRYRAVVEAVDEAREAAAALDRALERLEAAPDDPAAKRGVEEARARLAKVLEAAREAVKAELDAPPLLGLDDEFKKELRGLAERLEGARADEEETTKQLDGRPAAGSIPGARSALDRLRRRLEDGRKDYAEGVELPLEVLEKTLRLMAASARFAELARAQDDLALRVGRFASGDAPAGPDAAAALKGLEDEQQALAEELTRVLEEIRNAAARLPGGEPYDALRAEAVAFATAVVEAGAPEALEAARAALHKRSGPGSADLTRKAADLLLSFVKRCQGLGQGAEEQCLAFRPSLAEAMAEAMRALQRGAPKSGSGGAGAGVAGQGGTGGATPGGSMGLYGPLPTRGGGGARGPTGGLGGGRGAGSRGGGASADGPAGEPRTDLQYGGVPIQVVPGEYRAAVREYFRRVAEESGRRRN